MTYWMFDLTMWGYCLYLSPKMAPSGSDAGRARYLLPMMYGHWQVCEQIAAPMWMAPKVHSLLLKPCWAPHDPHSYLSLHGFLFVAHNCLVPFQFGVQQLSGPPQLPQAYTVYVCEVAYFHVVNFAPVLMCSILRLQHDWVGSQMVHLVADSAAATMHGHM